MNYFYPEWAPEILVEAHKKMVKENPRAKKGWMSDANDFIAELAQTGAVLSPDELERIRPRKRRTFFDNSIEEFIALLELLITDVRMKSVWKALSKRVKTDKDFYEFFRRCITAITEWRGDPKQTASERRACYRDILRTVKKLSLVLKRSSKFDFYSPVDLVSDIDTQCLLAVLGVPERDFSAPNNVRYLLRKEAIPSVRDILRDMAERAKKYAEEESLVKKPNSPNAELHYFIRSLSAYCSDNYGRPLDQVVATTTSVIFDPPRMDVDYVRKIVRR